MVHIDTVLPTKDFLDRVIGNIVDQNIDITDFVAIDHIAFRVETLDRYDDMKEILSKSGKKISEEIISGRSISVFKLQEPIIANQFKIYCIELPAPKEGSFYKEGWEHVEIVINDDLEEYASFYPYLNFKRSYPTENNKELVLKFDDGTAVKFHNKSLEEIIKSETINL